MEDRLSFKVEGMKCGGCVESVRRALERVPGVTVDRVELTDPVEIRVDPSKVDRKDIRSAVERAGFRPVFDVED